MPSALQAECCLPPPLHGRAASSAWSSQLMPGFIPSRPGRPCRCPAGRRLRARVSRNTVLRLVDALPEPQPPVPRVVGVDEYAMRKGRVYGTVLIDVETRRPVGLLPDREAGTVAAWLAERPGIEVVCRDRAPFFAEDARTGAPTAVQVADRFHLWCDLGEAAERCVSRHRSCLRAIFANSAPAAAPAKSGSPWPTGHRFADRTRAKHATVHMLLAAGHSRRRSIQRQLGMTYRTVQRLADTARPEDLFQRLRRRSDEDCCSTHGSPGGPPGSTITALCPSLRAPSSASLSRSCSAVA